MNNSCYGKTLESNQNRFNVLLVCSENEIGEPTSSHSFCAFKIFDGNQASNISNKKMEQTKHCERDYPRFCEVSYV